MRIAIGGGAALAGLLLTTSIFVFAKPLSAGTINPEQQPTNQNAQISTPTTDSDHASAKANNKNEPILAEAKAISLENVSREGHSYTATAYCLKGRTASGRMVARGIIAADPRVLPLGTRVLVSAGTWSGEYLVADTGGGIKGRKIDIWVPSSGEARKIGRRNVKLTVISFPERKGKAAKKSLLKPIPVTEQQRPRVVREEVDSRQ